MAKQPVIGSQALKIVRKYFPTVKKVNDADSDLTIEVTKNDSNAKRKNHSECALAVACKRSQHADGVIISTSTAYVIKAGIATRYKMPESASREVVSFDRGAGFAEGTYRLRRPCKEQRLGAYSQLGHGTGEHEKGNGKKQIQHTTTNVRTSLKSDKER